MVYFSVENVSFRQLVRRQLRKRIKGKIPQNPEKDNYTEQYHGRVFPVKNIGKFQVKHPVDNRTGVMVQNKQNRRQKKEIVTYHSLKI